eukprot:TRINITY_DN27933_c0_g2_i1.p1 TRINITY_DN27933_c0_g2~~TRINITY_DN27933_c0_g2_i1.p1  ORF type:complete len:211 (+),score=29.41 TRINITY_DN27933_c0_g2_i1:53-685(+)
MAEGEREHESSPRMTSSTIDSTSAMFIDTPDGEAQKSAPKEDKQAAQADSASSMDVSKDPAESVSAGKIRFEPAAVTSAEGVKKEGKATAKANRRKQVSFQEKDAFDSSDDEIDMKRRRSHSEPMSFKVIDPSASSSGQVENRPSASPLVTEFPSPHEYLRPSMLRALRMQDSEIDEDCTPKRSETRHDFPAANEYLTDAELKRVMRTFE